MNSRSAASSPIPAREAEVGHRGLIDHRRNPSAGSTVSAPPEGYHDVLMRTLEGAPAGSKLAEDAARAMMLAERARRREVREGKQPERRTSVASTHSAMSSIGSAMLSPLAPVPQSPAASNIGPFEFDDDQRINSIVDSYFDFDAAAQGLGLAYTGDTVDPKRLKDPLPAPQWGLPRHPDVTPQSMAAPPLPTGPTRRGTIPRQAKVDAFKGVPLDQNAIGIFWRGDGPQVFGLISYNTDNRPLTQDDLFHVEVMGRTTQVIEVPPYWTGRVQKMTGSLEDPATHAEMRFDGFAHMTFFKVSYIAGHNGPVMVRANNDDRQSGCAFRAIDHVPLNLMTRDSSGKKVIKGVSARVTEERQQLVSFYRRFFEFAHQGQFETDNERATAATHDKHLLAEFF